MEDTDDGGQYPTHETLQRQLDDAAKPLFMWLSRVFHLGEKVSFSPSTRLRNHPEHGAPVTCFAALFVFFHSPGDRMTRGSVSFQASVAATPFDSGSTIAFALPQPLASRGCPGQPAFRAGSLADAAAAGATAAAASRARKITATSVDTQCPRKTAASPSSKACGA